MWSGQKKEQNSLSVNLRHFTALIRTAQLISLQLKDKLQKYVLTGH